MKYDQSFLEEMVNNKAVVSASDLLVQLNKDNAPEGTYETAKKPKKKLGRGIALVVSSALICGIGVVGYQWLEGQSNNTEVTEQADTLSFDEPADQNTGSVNKELDPVVDAVKEKKATEFGTTIIQYKDRNLPPYEKPKCGIKDTTCVEEGISPADDLTGNNLNDKVGAYRLDLGHRSVRTLDSSFVSPEIIISAMTDTVTRLGLNIPIPSKVDYPSARVYSSGYSLWGIGEGYFLIYGNSQGIGVVGPDNKKETFSKALTDSKEILITQSYAGKKAVTFAPLAKKVPGSVGVDVQDESEWQ